MPGGGQMIVNAKNAFRDYDKGILELRGDVQVIYDQQYLSADRATINEKTHEVTAEGNLVISSPTAYTEGDRAVMNYRTNTGVIYNGFVKSGQVIFEGRVVRKTGPLQYEAETASFTACTTCPTAWTFAGSRMKAEMGGYAHIKHSVLKVAGLPVLWLPYLIVPLKSERQTGLLTPSLDFSASGGVALGLRYFWAMSRSQDMTLSLINYSLRGVKGLVNYRYVLSEESWGELNTGLIRDQTFAADPIFRVNPVGTRANRWFVSYDHSFDLPNNFNQKTKLAWVSDLRYPRDFPEEIPGRGDPALENRLGLTRNTEEHHMSLDAAYYINLLKTNPIDTNRDTVHRWPELRYGFTERPIWGTNLMFNFNADYVNFAREDYAFDDVTKRTDNATGRVTKEIDVTRTNTPINTPTTKIEGRGGEFDPDIDIIRAGQRLDLRPEISYPFHIGRYIDVLPSIQFRHTQYSFNVSAPNDLDFDPSPFRQFLRGRISFKTRYYRVYGPREPQLAAPSPVTSWVDSESRGQNSTSFNKVRKPVKPSVYRHEIEPEIAASGAPYIRQTGNFGEAAQIPTFLDALPVSDSDFQTRGIQFDSEDRLIYRNSISLLINNKLVRKTYGLTPAEDPTYKQIVSFKLGQSFDLDEARRKEDPKFPWSDLSALLDIRMDNFETNTLARYFHYHNVVSTSSRARAMTGEVVGKQTFVELSFAQTFNITRNVSEANIGRSENVGFSAGFDSRYLTFLGTVNFAPWTFWPMDYRVRSWGTEMRIKPPGDCWGIRTKFEQSTGDELRVKVDFDYLFGGQS